MCIFGWLFSKKEPISDETVEHSSKGTYGKNGNRLISGGHGQEAIDYMDNNNIKYNIVKTYKNGVRVGNVPKHKNKLKQKGTAQSWFPKDWDRKKIKQAGQVVARGKRLPDGSKKFGHYDEVNVVIIRTKGKVGTIFPNSPQKNRRGKEKK